MLLNYCERTKQFSCFVSAKSNLFVQLIFPSKHIEFFRGRKKWGNQGKWTVLRGKKRGLLIQQSVDFKCFAFL